MTRGLKAWISGCFAGAGPILLPFAAWAHPGDAVTSSGASFLGGILHPLVGSDHLIAISAVGLWAGYLGGRALFGIPLAFLGMMSAGAVLGHSSVAVPAVDHMIAVSLVVFGLLICLLVRLPPSVAACIVALFGAFHGYAHGAETPDAAEPLVYGAGFLIATTTLLALGGALGFVGRQRFPVFVVRAAGMAITAFGTAMILNLFA